MPRKGKRMEQGDIDVEIINMFEKLNTYEKNRVIKYILEIINASAEESLYSTAEE